MLQLPEKVACQIAFENAFDFPVTQAFSSAPLHVLLGGFIESHARFDDDVQGHVELPVAMTVEPVPDGVSRGGLQGCRPGEGREGGFGPNPAMVGVGGEDDPDGYRAQPGWA